LKVAPTSSDGNVQNLRSNEIPIDSFSNTQSEYLSPMNSPKWDVKEADDNQRMDSNEESKDP